VTISGRSAGASGPAPTTADRSEATSATAGGAGAQIASAATAVKDGAASLLQKVDYSFFSPCTSEREAVQLPLL